MSEQITKAEAIEFFKNHAAWLKRKWFLSVDDKEYYEQFLKAIAAVDATEPEIPSKIADGVYPATWGGWVITVIDNHNRTFTYEAEAGVRGILNGRATIVDGKLHSTTF